MVRLRFLCVLTVFCACLPLAGQDARSSDPKQRIKAAREMAKQGASAIPQLQTLLSDSDTDVRVEAVKALIEVDTQHSLNPLIQATQDNDSEIQIRATDGLVNFYLPGYVKSGLSASLSRVRSAVKSRWSDTNDQAIDPYVQVRPEVVSALAKLVRGGVSMEVRANAARAAGILRAGAASPELVNALRSKDDRLIYESLVALQKIRDPKVAPNITFLMRDLNEKIQITTIETTGLLRNREALPQLREALGRARNNKVRRAALSAIAMIPDPASRELYARYLTDKDDGLRAAAAEGYARLKNPADLPTLEKAFNEETKMSPRLSLAFALVNLGKAEISELSPLQYLINTLNSSSWKGVARPFLIEVSRDPVIRKPVQEATKRGTKEEKIQLAQILALSGDKDTVPYLDELSKDRDTEVAQEAINAMRTLKARLL
jgi:HEAT repeat protein